MKVDGEIYCVDQNFLNNYLSDRFQLYKIVISSTLWVHSSKAYKYYFTLYVGSSALGDLTFLLGEEVALYCAKYLPDIIKDQKAYKEGKLQKVCLFVMLLLYFCRLSLVF